MTTPAADPKSKTAAVLLAVFLSLCTWIYTHGRDAWKFWSGVCLLLAAVWTIIFVDNQWRISAWVLLAALWMWAVLDACLKDETWYRTY